jgi:hypothetical protein
MHHLLRTNLTLLFIITLLVLLVWWSQPESLPPLSRLTPQQINSIEIDGQTREPVSMTLIRNQWLIGERPGNDARIKQLLKICRTPSLRRFPAPQNLEPFGLSLPDLVLRLNQEQFAFGDIDPINGWRYVLHRDEVHLIGNGFHHHLLAPIEAWLEKPDA